MQFALLPAIFVFYAVTSVAALATSEGARRELAFDVAEIDRRDGPCMGANGNGRRELVTFDLADIDRREGPCMGAKCGIPRELVT